MEGTSFAPSYRHEATRDLTNKAPRKLYNQLSSPADIATIKEFLHGPITENGSKYGDNVQINDVLDVIQTDPDFSTPSTSATPSTSRMSYQLPVVPDLFHRGREILQPTPAVPVEQSNRGALKKGVRGGAVRRSSVPAKPDNRDPVGIPRLSSRHQPYVKILEQPAPKILRFRYVCESRSAGSFPGKSSTPDNPTYPTIQIVGYRGKAVVVVSCVTKDPPHKPHPFNLVSKAVNEDYRNGICITEVDTNENHGVIQFIGMGVQCVKRRGMAASLAVRQELHVDPFRTGFSHRNKPTSIDLVAVRLCFQVFIEGDTPGRVTVPLTPVVSEPVYDKRRAAEPKIMKLSDCVSSVAGGKKDIILLCEKVTKGDIQVRFYEENGDWEAFADFEPSQIHKQYAICFKTPRYKTSEVANPVKVLVQLRRPSDGATSESLPFELWPSSLLEQEPFKPKRKKTEKLEQLRSLQEVARGGGFPENFYTMDATRPVQGGTPYLPNGAPLTPQGDPANPLGYPLSSIYSPNTQGPVLGTQTLNHPTYSSSLSYTSCTPNWNIPRNDVLQPQKRNSTTNGPDSKEIMDLDSGDLKWLMGIVEPQDPNLTNSLSKMVLKEFYPN